MRGKIKKFIKLILGTENNIIFKLDCSFFISAILFLIFSLIVQEQNNIQACNMFLCISSLLFGSWLSSVSNYTSVKEFLKELFRLTIFFIVLVFSLNFCINSCINVYGTELLIKSILSCIGILLCTFYLVAKFIDIFNWFKKIFIQIKHRIFDSVQPAASKARALIENITAFLVAIAGLGVAIKTIIEPLINLFK